MRLRTLRTFICLLLVACAIPACVRSQQGPGATSPVGDHAGAPDAGGQTGQAQVLAQSQPAALSEGTEHGGGGGDEDGLLFKTAALTALDTLQSKNQLPSKVNHEDLKKLVEECKVIVSDEQQSANLNQLKQSGIATNYPDLKTIVVNRIRWQALANTSVREAIALHEVLSLVGLESTGNYTYSQAYLMMAGITCMSNLCDSGPFLNFADPELKGAIDTLVAKSKVGPYSKGGVAEANIDVARSILAGAPKCSPENQNTSGPVLVEQAGSITSPSFSVGPGEYLVVRSVSCGEPNFSTPSALFIRPPGSTRWLLMTDTMIEVQHVESYGVGSKFSVVVLGSIPSDGGRKTLVIETLLFSPASSGSESVQFLSREQKTQSADD